MKTSVTFNQFVDDFMSGQYKNNFSYDGLRALFDYLEQFEEDCGEELNYDVVAIACDFSEYESVEEFLNDYKPDITSFEEWCEEDDDRNKNCDISKNLYYEDEEIQNELKDWINDRTQLILLGNSLEEGFIVGCF